MISITDGKEIRVQGDKPWEISDGYLILSLHEARDLRQMLNFDNAELFETEPEDG